MKENQEKSMAKGPVKKSFSEEFKREALALIESGRAATQVSRELGVSTWSLSQWKKHYRVGGAGAGSVGRSPKGSSGGGADPVAMSDELGRLRQELQAVTRQRDILKKALAILGQE